MTPSSSPAPSALPPSLDIVAVGTVVARKENMHSLATLWLLGVCCPLFLHLCCAGNVARFLNHSCDPNLLTQAVLVEGSSFAHHKVAFFVAEPEGVAAGEELCYDYKWTRSTSVNQVFCKCGAPKCRGQLL